MDVYVKLWGLKYNFGKVQDAFYKIQGSDYFLDLRNYYPKENSVE
jgi:hypothetical protein